MWYSNERQVFYHNYDEVASFEYSFDNGFDVWKMAQRYETEVQSGASDEKQVRIVGWETLRIDDRPQPWYDF